MVTAFLLGFAEAIDWQKRLSNKGKNDSTSYDNPVDDRNRLTLDSELRTPDSATFSPELLFLTNPYQQQ